MQIDAPGSINNDPVSHPRAALPEGRGRQFESQDFRHPEICRRESPHVSFAIDATDADDECKCAATDGSAAAIDRLELRCRAADRSTAHRSATENPDQAGDDTGPRETAATDAMKLCER